MVDIADERLRQLRAKRRGDAATRVATDERGDVAEDARTDVATEPATRAAAGLRSRKATEPATVRRAYTVYRYQDEMLDKLARDLDTDKSDVLRQIIDDWRARH